MVELEQKRETEEITKKESKMPIYKYSFPIPNYEGDGVFDQEIFIEADSCPSWEEVKEVLEKEDEFCQLLTQDGKTPYDASRAYCLKALSSLSDEDKDFLRLATGQAYAAVPVETKYGPGSVSVKKIIIHSVGEEGVVKLGWKLANPD